jgi:hypothetical protein
MIVSSPIGSSVNLSTSLSNVAKLAAHPKFVWVFNANCDGTVIYNDPVYVELKDYFLNIFKIFLLSELKCNLTLAFSINYTNLVILSSLNRTVEIFGNLCWTLCV